MKRIAILGSTGSIGRQTLDVVRCFPERFHVVALTAGQNVELLTKQITEFKPKYISALDEIRVQHAIPLSPEEISCHPDVDLVVIATSGKAGFKPTLSAIRAGKRIALANKEVLVMAGEIIMAEARMHDVQILPLDSEHSAIWQCMRGEQRESVSQIILTASGGPFRNYSSEQLAAVTPEQALAHPTWRMGTKVTIDSATLMNKGMEIIEARWLFDMPVSHISVIVHHQSIIHSFLEFADGSIKAQLSPPDMHLPIQYALCYPERVDSGDFPKLDWGKLNALDFNTPDLEKFPCLRLALDAIERGGTYPAVLCAADEIAVELFLNRTIGFMDIPRLVEQTLEKHQGIRNYSLEDILATDAWARDYTRDRGLSLK